VKSKRIKQADLTSECWSVQVWGLVACERCELQGSRECGGRGVLKRIKRGEFPSTGLSSVKVD